MLYALWTWWLCGVCVHVVRVCVIVNDVHVEGSLLAARPTRDSPTWPVIAVVMD